MTSPCCILNLITQPGVSQPSDFEDLAVMIEGLARDVRARVLPDERMAPEPQAALLPTLTFSPGPLQRFRPPRGPVFQGQPLPKSEEYRRLEQAGIPVPKWVVLRPGGRLDLTNFDPYVVMKPDHGARGADVRITERRNVRWAPPRTRLATRFGGVLSPWVVQDFVYTGKWPVSYRVVTLFGHALFSVKVEASRERRPLLNRNDFGGESNGVSIVSSGKGCRFELSADAEIIALGQRAHGPFPKIPLLGVDILRDADTRELYVVEVNSLGHTWHFSSATGLRLKREFGLDHERQFDGRRKAARILAEVALHHAA